MKECPICGQIYTDDTLRFCLADGTPLNAVYSATEEPTLVRPDLPAAPTTNKEVIVRGVHPGFKYLAVILSAFLLLLIGAGAAFFLLRDDPDNRTSDPADRSPGANVPGSTPEAVNVPTRSDSEKKGVAERTVDPKAPKATKPTSAETPQPAADPATTRITFRRGSTGETISASVTLQRAFVLRTLAGQLLSANVRSPGGCAVFESGSDTTAFTTASGDNFLRIKNKCDAPTRFTMRVAVR